MADGAHEEIAACWLALDCHSVADVGDRQGFRSVTIFRSLLSILLSSDPACRCYLTKP